MEDFDKNDEINEEMDGKFRQEIYSKSVRAGKRTYFFDVKSTRKDEYYLTITESKKRYEQDGKYHFEKHKIFLYKEDFEKFANGLNEVVDFILGNQPYDETVEAYDQNGGSEEKSIQAVECNEEMEPDEEEMVKDYTSVEFDDLNS